MATIPKERRGWISARARLLASLCAGLAIGAVAGVLGADRAAPLAGWDGLAVVFGGWVWDEVWKLDPASTAQHVRRENPGRGAANRLLLGAAVASLLAVGLLLFRASNANGALKYLEAGFAVLSVFVSWTLIHTVFTLKYARLYYSGQVGGIDFNEDADPQYSDFAYLAFTIGMTFAVSDSDIRSKEVRRALLCHAWLSFPFGAIIIATTINLVSGLAT